MQDVGQRLFWFGEARPFYMENTAKSQQSRLPGAMLLGAGEALPGSGVRVNARPLIRVQPP